MVVVMPRFEKAAVMKLDYEVPRAGRWRWPGWPLALAWLPCCLCGASVGAYVATLVLFGGFGPEAFYVVPGRVLAGAALAAAVTSPVFAWARFQPWAKISSALAAALCLTFIMTLIALYPFRP